VAVSLATGRWEELRPQEGQMVLVESLQREQGALQNSEEGEQNTGGWFCQSPEPPSIHRELQRLTILQDHGRQDDGLNRTS